VKFFSKLLRPFRFFLLAIAVLLAGAGCAHYRLGTEAKLPFASIYLAPVQNQAGLPQAVAIFSARLREAFLRDGRVALAASPAEADAVLTVILTEQTRTTLTTRPADTGLARKLGLTIDATATLSDRRTGRALFENRPLRVERQVFTDSGQLQAEYDAVPLLAEKLAEAAARAALDVW
jgi:hypothetical protein